MKNPKERLRRIEEKLKQFSDGVIYLEIEQKNQLIKEKNYLLVYMEKLQSILKENPYLDATVGCGYQNFQDFVCGRQFYVDKTHFITEWIRSKAKVTLITRPRRFGKTTLLSTVENFLDPRYSGHPEYFEKLRVWKEKENQKLYGKIPVISISFGSCKGSNYKQAIRGMIDSLFILYETHEYLLYSEKIEEEDKTEYRFFRDGLRKGEEDKVEMAISRLCRLLRRHYDCKPVILIDEYDTPLLEAYTDGYWNEMIGTCRQLFHCTLKENPYYSRAIITGVTRVTHNSLFSDLNNIEVDTVTCDPYSDCFGFTEKEVKDALKCQDIDQFQEVKAMYDGFIFGNRKDMYNPWSICNYLRQGKLLSYWTNTSSNKLIGEIIRKYPVRSKYEIELLMTGAMVHKKINEHVTFQYLDGDENSLWSLLLAVGYVKADHVLKYGEITECDVSITNQEVMEMFRYEILSMFENGTAIYHDFVSALLSHKPDEMRDILMDISYTSMSYFDVGKRPSECAPENFYHGLVLGLIVSLRENYRIISNRESGRGRYDIAIYPLQANEDGYIMEFKVCNKNETLEHAAENALAQIEEKKYEADLLAAGIAEENIYKLGIAFSGKDVLVKQKNSKTS